MAARLRDALDGGEARRDKIRDIFQRFSFNDDHEVETAAHEVDSADLIESIDTFRNRIETDLALRHEIHLDDGCHHVVAELFPVDERVVGENHLVLFQTLDILLNLIFALAEHGRDLTDRATRIVL